VINFVLYLLAEAAIAACDLAEVLGMAIGIKLLTGLPLVWGVSITILDTFLLLYLQKLGMRKMEAFIITLVAIVALAFLAEIIMAKPDIGAIGKGMIPSLPDSYALYITTTIIGATVMPHNLYLHSALVQTRKISKDDESIRLAIKFNRIDSTIALNVAFLVNAAILILASSVFFTSGNSDVASIEDAHKLLPSFLGNLAPVLFAVALIAAGQSSTITGTLAGQIIMEGYLSLRINPLLRRLITRLIAIVPALLVIIIAGEEKVQDLLLFSQAILSMQLAFAIIPLIHFVRDKKTMGHFAINPLTQGVAWLISAVLISLNVKILVDKSIPVFSGNEFLPKLWIIVAALGFLFLLLYIIIYPWLGKKPAKASIRMHPEISHALTLTIPSFSRIAVALDFSENDDRLISFAVGQGSKESSLLLVHIVESASARLLGKESDDYETQKDKERMDFYISHLKEKNIDATGVIGYRGRVKEIARIVAENNSDLLVIGAHGHKALKDFVYGETVNAVRHEVKIPVLVVNL
jgi:manganese transport protein